MSHHRTTSRHALGLPLPPVSDLDQAIASGPAGIGVSYRERLLAEERRRYWQRRKRIIEARIRGVG